MYDAEFENEALINGDLRESQSVGKRKALLLQLLLVLAEGNSTIVCFSRVQRMLALNKGVV